MVTINKKNSIVAGLMLFSALFLASFSSHACHAVVPVNFTVTPVAGGINVNASSSQSTCGCTQIYWLDIEIRCMGEPFNPAPFSPNFYGPLNSYPFFQSPQLNKVQGCQLVPYQTTFIPYTSMCPGITYQIRARENHNTTVSNWTAPTTFTVPGNSDPLVVQANATDINICAGDCVTLSADVVGGCDFAPTYVWSNGANTQTTQVCPNVTTTYTVNVTEQCSGFTDQAQITINVLPPPDPGVASIDDPIVCEGLTTNINIVGQQGVIQWQIAPSQNGPWSNIPGATNTSEATPPVMADACFRAEITGCGPASYTNIVCVEVAPLPDLTVGNETMCQGETVDLVSNVDLTGGLYMWNNDPSLNSASLTGLSPTENTTYTLTYNLDGCIVSTTADITVYALPNPAFEVEAICEGNNIEFINLSNIDNNNGDAITQWLWNLGDGNSSSIQNPIHAYPGDGVYQVTLTAISNYGCEASFTGQAVVYPVPVVNFSPIDACLEQPNQFVDQTVISNQNTTNNIVLWEWDFGDGNTANSQNPTHTYQADGTYNVTLTVTSNNGCTVMGSNVVTVHPLPVVNFNNTPIQGCEPVCFDIASSSQVSSGSSIVQHTWTYSNGVSFNTGDTPMHSNCLSNNTVNPIILGVTLQVVTDKGCVNTHTVPNLIEVYHNPIADFSITPDDVSVLDTEVRFNNQSLYASNYQWTIVPWGNSTEQNPIIEFPYEPSTYDIQLVAITDQGCTDTVVGSVEVKDVVLFYIPNTFTPDGDPYNQQFKPIFTSGFDPLDYNLLIFNRWGEVLFESNNAEYGWDGTYGASSERIVKDGTYLWKIEFKETMSDRRHTHTGHVNLLR
jgi:gliding motility-associated-like protein